MSRSEKNKLIFALALVMFLAAIESTIVTLAIPTITRDLHGFDLINHIFSVYLLVCALATPIHGKLSDLYGRKRVLMIGVILFVLGCALCGFSQNMYMLITFRAIQGIGAGAIFTVPMIIVGDVFPLSERGKIQGVLSMVWGIAAILGPVIGGTLIGFLSWHWIFFINIPFGIVALIIIQTSFNESFTRSKQRIDYPGILVLSCAMVAFLSIFVFGGDQGIQLNIKNVLLFISSILLLILFFFIERRAVEPILPFEVFTRSSIFVNVAAMLFSGVLIAVDIYLAIYLQNVKGFQPLIAGLLLLPMSVSWTLVSIPLGRLMLRFGGKSVHLVGILVALCAIASFVVITQASSVFFIIFAVFVMGIGFGIGLTTQTMIIQNSVKYDKRGAAMGVNSLLKTLGQAIAVSIFGATFNASVIQGFSQEGIVDYDLSRLYDLSSYAPGVTWEQVVNALSVAIHSIGVVLIGIMLLCTILAGVMPKPPLSQEEGRPGKG